MKEHYRLFIGILLGLIISVTGSVWAETLVNSEDVPYSNTDSSGTYADVQDAIDELYHRAQYVGKLYQEELLNGAYPVLGENMIPIYLSDNGDAYYADLYTKWYSYKEKKWANAVILVDSAKDKYHTGDKILEEYIESYFVWIPRYAYKIWDLGNYSGFIAGNTLNDSSYEKSPSKASNNARIIDVVFGSVDRLVQNGGDIKKLTWNSQDGTFSEPNDIAVDNYLIHPAFTFGNDELNGIWMGKFDAGYNQSNNGETSITNINNWKADKAKISSNDSKKIIVKPNVYAWRSNTVKNIFDAAKGYNEILNSHMMKNTEWGAAAYLSHSAYGKGSEININNTSDAKTGFSALNSEEKSYQGEFVLSSQTEKTQPWNTATGYLASSTGNITGIYDMSGGALEWVAATIMSENGNKPSGDASGFSTEEEITEQMKRGFIDAYPSNSSIYSYNNRILGDAIGEIGPFYSYNNKEGKRAHNSWYSDYSHFMSDTNPWLARGGDWTDGALSGQFMFIAYSGVINGQYGFRLVLTVGSRAS